LTLGDTSFTFYNLAHLNSYYFDKLLADSVDGKEKQNNFIGVGFYVTPKDTIAANEKDKRIEQNLKDYKITPTVIKDFNRLKNILTWRDTSEHYIIVFKKKFSDKIFKLYN
jgi:hypothetical protein